MSGVNADQQAFWTDQAGPTWVAQMVAMDQTLQPVLDALLARADIAAGDHVIDIGCGAGSSTLDAAARTGAEGRVTGVDISETLLKAARDRAEGVAHVRFALGDAQTFAFDAGASDHVISRFGVMFFDDTVAAFANMAGALKRDGRMTFATWGEIPENPYFTLPARVAKDVVGAVPKSDPDAPGPFALRDVDRVRAMLREAGLAGIEAEQRQMMLTPGGDAASVMALMCEIGPAQRALSYFEADAATRARLRDALAAALEQYVTPEGIRLPALINLFTARNAA